MKINENPNRDLWPSLTERPVRKAEDLDKIISAIFDEVQKKGDKALRAYTEQFDRVKLDDFRVNSAEIESAGDALSTALKEAIVLAKNNIEIFHASQLTGKNVVKTTVGVSCWQEMRPIEKVGLYIPGGTAPLFSTILMLGIPAKLAGCKEVVLCTPPNTKGSVDPAILYTAGLLGIESVYKVGGAQAIAAMTYGTASIPKVYKIFGPGNQFVTAAKQFALNKGVAIDMPAGPSELMVVADSNAKASFVASDLLSQAEHGADSQVICITDTVQKLEEIKRELSVQLANLPRKDTAQLAIDNSQFLVLESLQDRIDFINEYAPEHLILNVVDESLYLDKIINSGSVFIGPYTPESAGDYASGTNHTLPTNSYARMYSGVNMDAFTKKITFQKISREGIQQIGEAIELMAEAEGLQAHKNAVSLRLQDIKDNE